MSGSSDTGASLPAVKVKTPDNKYIQIDSCWAKCAMGPDSASDTREGQAGQRGITSYGIIPVALLAAGCD